MKKMDRRMALVTLISDFGKPVRLMLPPAGTSCVVCANWTCEDFPHFAETVAVLLLGEECRRVNEYIKKQREEGFNCLLTYVQMCSMYFLDEFLLEACLKFLRACLDRDFPSLPLWRPCFVGQWEAAGADDAVDMFAGSGPGCRGAAIRVLGYGQ
eukprot:jgi/Tetstr1/466422/TSEL_010950.t1